MQPKNRLPRGENEAVINETLRRARLEFGAGASTITGGGGGGGGGGGSNATPYVPTLIPDGSTFTVPADTQLLWKVPIRILGTLQINGAFMMAK